MFHLSVIQKLGFLCQGICVILQTSFKIFLPNIYGA